MNILRKLLGVPNNSGAKDYDHYVVQKRQGGIYGKWETIEELPDFLDSTVGVATYGDGIDISVRCLGVKKLGDREIKKQLWQHISREDIEEEIEERKKRVGKKDKSGGDFDRFYYIINEIKQEIGEKTKKELELERIRNEKELGMVQDFYEKYFNLYTSMGSQNAEANKYTVLQQGVHELSEVGKEIVKELYKSKDDSVDEDENFEEYKKKALPPAEEQVKKEQPIKDFTPLKIMCKFIENEGNPSTYLETMNISYSDHLFYQTLIACEDADHFLSKLKTLEQKLPILFGDKGKVWLEEFFKILTTFKQGEVEHELRTEIKSAADNSTTPESDAGTLSEH